MSWSIERHAFANRGCAEVRSALLRLSDSQPYSRFRAGECSPNFGTLLAHQAGARPCFRIRVAGESTVSFKIVTLPISVCENRSSRAVLTTFVLANRPPSLRDWRGVCRYASPRSRREPLSGLRRTLLLIFRHCHHEFFGAALYFAFGQRFSYGS